MDKPEEKDVFMAIYKEMVASDRRRISHKSDRFRKNHEASYTAWYNSDERKPFNLSPSLRRTCNPWEVFDFCGFSAERYFDVPPFRRWFPGTHRHGSAVAKNLQKKK